LLQRHCPAEADNRVDYKGLGYDGRRWSDHVICLSHAAAAADYKVTYLLPRPNATTTSIG